MLVDASCWFDILKQILIVLTDFQSWCFLLLNSWKKSFYQTLKKDGKGWVLCITFMNLSLIVKDAPIWTWFLLNMPPKWKLELTLVLLCWLDCTDGQFILFQNMLRFLMVGITGLIVLAIPNFANLMALVGATCCTLLAFILPGLFHIQIYRKYKG